MADVIYVTAQVLDKRLRTLEQGVNNIVPFTRRLPQIAAKADEALTIAQRLSGQMAKLGPLFRIVGIVANILAIVEQVAIIKTFADRIESVDNQLDAHDAQLTKMNGLLLSTRKRLSESEAKVKNLNNIAAEARSNAKKALTSLSKIETKVKSLNDDVAQLKTHSKESIGRIDLIEPKLKSLNDDVYEAKVHANDALNDIDNLILPKLKNLNDGLYENKERTKDALDSIEQSVKPKLKSLNDGLYETTKRGQEATQGISAIQSKLKSLNDELYVAKTQSSQATSQLKTLEPAMKNITAEVIKLNAGASATNNKVNALEGKITIISSDAAQARIRADQALSFKAIPGPQGAVGLQGVRGATGATGLQGVRGATGAVGATGLQGVRGAIGATGAVGATGRAGIDGRPGRDGKDGKDGKDVDEADVNAIKKSLADITAKVVPLALFTVAVNGINQNVNRSVNQLPSSEAFKAGVAAGNCRTTQPGGCMSKKFDESNGKIDRNGQGIDRVNAALNAADLGLLGVVNDKLGDKIPGGISGRLGKVFNGVSKLWDTLQVDRVLNTLSWIGIMHNALMLSNSLGQTLFGAIDVWFDALGFKLTKMNDEGNPEDVSASGLVGSYTMAFANQVFGAENVAYLTVAWQKANRIYQAGANMLNAVQGMIDAARSIAELTAGHVGKIGNALINSGTVLENAYGRMQERVTSRSVRQAKVDEFLQAGIGGAENALSSIAQIGSDVVSFQEGAKELTEARTEFEKAKLEGEKFLTDKAEVSKKASEAPNIDDLVFKVAPQTEED